MPYLNSPTLGIDRSDCCRHSSAPQHGGRNGSGMLDRDIRPTLLHAVRTEHADAAVFHEFPVCRKGRADLVAVNAAMWGYEIKSERDTLARLAMQVERYDQIFNYSVLVAAERHLIAAMRIVPPHWGVMSVSGTAKNCVINELRSPCQNPNRSAEQIIRLLWKGECITVLKAKGINAQWSAGVQEIWGMLRELPIEELEESVRGILKARHF